MPLSALTKDQVVGCKGGGCGFCYPELNTRGSDPSQAQDDTLGGGPWVVWRRVNVGGCTLGSVRRMTLWGLGSRLGGAGWHRGWCTLGSVRRMTHCAGPLCSRLWAGAAA